MPYKIKSNCIYKKDTGEKVGCTSGNIQKYLSALKINSTNESNDSLVFDLDTYDHYKGQDNIKATLKFNNKLVAYADLARFEGKIYINFIESVVKGKGYGKELMRYLAKEYGYENLERSSLTPDGAKMRKDLDTEFGFDYGEHLKKQNKHLKLELINNIKNDLIKNFLLDCINLGYQEAWKKVLNNPNFRSLSNYLNDTYDLDFNDVASISEWFISSKTNNNDILDEPPHPVLKDLSILFKIPNDMLQENKIINRLKQTNKETLPKIPVEQIFFHEKPELALILDVTKFGNNDLEKNKGKGFKKEKVNVKMIIPTQDTVNLDNLDATKEVGPDTGAELVKHNQFYFVIDGHHRIANAIINNIDEIDAKVFTNSSKQALKEDLKGKILNSNIESKIKKLEIGIGIVCDDLNVKRPEIEYISDPNYTKVNKSFAAYSPSEKKVYVVIHNRNTADIMRSIAHELRHYKQDLDGVLHEKSGEDGDEFENDANAYSGKIMRKIGREVEGIFESLNKKIISEDYDTQEEMVKLANDIFKNMIVKGVNRTLETDGSFTPTMYPNIFNGLSHKYDKLNEFLKDYHLLFKLNKNGNGGSSAHFQGVDKRNGSIVLSKNGKEILEIIMDETLDAVFKGKRNGNTKFSEDELKELYRDIYFSLYNEKTILTLAHELQHAYDSWRSNGKYTSDSKSKKYYNDPLEVSGNNSQEKYNRYLKLHHEINARFTQAIAQSRIIEMEFSRDNPDRPFGYQYAVPINSFIKSFKLNFFGYNILNPKQQKYVLRRASQYYYAAKEKYEGKIKGKD